MKRQLIVIQLMLILCVGCASDKKLSKGYELPVVLNGVKPTLVDTAFFQSSSVIPLESTDSSLIRSIDRICMIDDVFYLLDVSLGKVLMYNEQGKCLGQIHDVGSGPGEYIRISDITVDPQRKNLILLCDRPYKVMYYTREGKLLKEVAYSDYYSEFVMSGDHIYCYKVGRNDEDYLLTYTYPLNLQKEEVLHKRPWFNSGSSNTLSYFDVGNRLTVSDAVYLTRPFENYIYVIDHNDIYEKYEIDFKKHQLPQSLLEERLSSQEFLAKCDENKYVCSITDVVGNQDYLFFKTNIGLFVYDKQQQQLDGYYFILNSALGGGSPKYLPVGNSSSIVQIIQPMQFKQYMSIKREREKNPEGSDSVYDAIYQNLHDEDNPVLVVYKLPNKI